MARLLPLQALDYACYTRGARLFGPMPYMAIGHKGLRCYWMCIRRRRTSSKPTSGRNNFQFVGNPEVGAFLRQLPCSPLERSRSRGGRYRVGKVGSCGARRQINFGSQGGPCDPSTKNHAGGTPASSLLRGYHTLLHPPCRKVRTTFQLLSGSFGSATHSP